MSKPSSHLAFTSAREDDLPYQRAVHSPSPAHEGKTVPLQNANVTLPIVRTSRGGGCFRGSVPSRSTRSCARQKARLGPKFTEQLRVDLARCVLVLRCHKQRGERLEGDHELIELVRLERLVGRR